MDKDRTRRYDGAVQTRKSGAFGFRSENPHITCIVSGAVSRSPLRSPLLTTRMTTTDTPSFYAPLADGRRFENVDTGEIHECYDACTHRVDMGDRVVCSLSNAVLGMSTCVRAAPRKRARDSVDSVEAKRLSAVRSRRRIGFSVVDSVFKDTSFPDDRKEKCVDVAMKIYDWLGDNIQFDAMTYAALMCMAEGVHTKTLIVPKDAEVAKHLRNRPLRCVDKLGIRQNAVTRAHTAMMKKKGESLCICD